MFCWKASALVLYEVLRLFVNTFTAGDKYSRRNRENFRVQVQTPLSQKQKTSCEFFIAFLKFAWNLEHIKKKMSILASLLPELMNLKEVVT